MVPNGYDLFKHGWPPPGDFPAPKTHQLYKEFLNKAREAGFEVESEGFQDSEDVYFMFFMMGRNATLV